MPNYRDIIDPKTGQLLLARIKKGGTTQLPAYENGWSDSSGTVPVKFWKDVFGVVHIAGVAKAGTVAASVNIFDLPVGYRPQTSYSQTQFCLLGMGAGPTYYIVKGFINPVNGAVNLLFNAADLGAITDVNLTGISFQAD